jgi:class 3 adenylate cyclase/tetratricopeptide (TPR) repeat protein
VRRDGVEVDDDRNRPTAIEAGSDTRPYTPQHVLKLLGSAPAVDGERKIVTAVFCDIVNSTALAERIGAEAIHELLERYFAMTTKHVHAEGGTINQFLGDGFLALFGAPIAHEDHAWRALRAMWSFVAALDAHPLVAPDGTRVDVRVGVNTGPVVVGTLGDSLRTDYTAIGDTVNLAARVQAEAAPGTIAFTEATLRAAGTAIDRSDVGARQVKGKTAPIQIYRLMAEPSAARPQSETSATLVGRAPQLEAANQLVAALASGRGGYLVVHGEAGIGKTRLLGSVRDRSASLRWLDASADPLTAVTGYGPFVSIVRDGVGIGRVDDDSDAWRVLSDSAPHILPGDPDALPYLAALARIDPPVERTDPDPRNIGSQILRVARMYVASLARQQPTVIAIEDAHWLDRSSAALLEHLLPMTAQVPLLIAVTTRDPTEAISMAERAGVAVTIVSLDALSDREGHELVREILGTQALTRYQREALVRRAGGNPLFLEELARSVLDPSEGPDVLTVPGGVDAIVMSRIDRLPPEVKELVGAAAVVGRRVPRPVLLAVLDRPAAEADRSIEDADRADILHADSPDVLVFKHALVQAAVYASILGGRRRQLHRAAAVAIEEVFADRLDEFSAVLANHYVQAEAWDGALTWLVRAGDDAGRVAADSEALASYETALDAYGRTVGDGWDPTARATLERKIADALFRLGDHDEAIDRLEIALARLGHEIPARGGAVRRAIAVEVIRRAVERRPRTRPETTSGELQAYECYRALSWMHYFLDPEAFVLDCLRMLRLSERHGSSDGIARGASGWALALDVLGRRRSAARYLSLAAAAAAESDDPMPRAEVGLAYGVHRFVTGDVAASIDDFTSSATAFRDAGDLRGWGVTTTLAAWAHRIRGDLATGADLLDDVRRVAIDSRDRELVAWATWEHGRRLILQGSPDEAVRTCQDASDLMAALPAPVDALDAISDVALARLAAGDAVDAWSIADRAYREARAAGARGYKLSGLILARAHCAVAAMDQPGGPPKRHAASATRAALRHSRGVPLAAPRAWYCSGMLRFRQGRRRAARVRWQRGLEHADRCGLRYEAALLAIAIARDDGDTERLEAAIGELDLMGATAEANRARTADL